MDGNRRVIKKEYIPQSKAYKVYYEGGGVGYGSDSGNNEFMPQYIADQKTKMDELVDSQKAVMGDAGTSSLDEIRAQRGESFEEEPDDETSDERKKLLEELRERGD